ncbi:unnamed protein product [Musa hybrid cultivar]
MGPPSFCILVLSRIIERLWVSWISISRSGHKEIVLVAPAELFSWSISKICR